MPTKVVRTSRIGRKGGAAKAAPRSLVDEGFARVHLSKFNRLKPLAYALDTSTRASTSAVIESYAVTPILAPNIAIGINPTTGFANITATLATATVTGSGPTPTGTVQFQVDGVNVGAPQTLVGGVASLSITGGNFPTPDTDYSITYVYSGDSHYSGGTSPVATYHTEAS